MASDPRWRDLHTRVSLLRENYPERSVWEDIMDPDQHALDFLVQTNWRVRPKADMVFMGMIPYYKKRMFYRESLDPPRRDITICHELAHVFYPTKIYQEDFSMNEWEDVIEWIGRRWRRKPEILRMIFKTFDVRPTRIYDRVTRKAFPEQQRPRIPRPDYGCEQVAFAFNPEK